MAHQAGSLAPIAHGGRSRASRRARSRASKEGARVEPSREASTLNGNGRPTTGSGRKVLVLNASYEPINVCSQRRAVILVLKAKAEVLEEQGAPIHSECEIFERPAVIRLMTYVKVPRDTHRRRITRKAVLARDEWTCQYCGDRKSGMTIDHIVPRSRGGESVWENIVAACGGCNRRKGDRLPHEISMHPRTSPRPPAPTIFIQVASPNVPATWLAYIPGMATA